jgi:hypothetical protein
MMMVSKDEEIFGIKGNAGKGGKKKGHEEDSLQSGRNLPSCIVREPLKYST